MDGIDCMEKTIYLHIGGRKTGTTAIQLFLSSNRAQLKKKGYLYPGYPRQEHHDITREILFHSLSKTSVSQVLKKYREEIRRSPCNNVILSAEGLEGLFQKVSLLEEFLLQDSAVRIIFYVRRQDERIESNYNQMVKGAMIRTHETFSQYYGSGNLPLLDYYNVLLPWRDAFGKENILVRCYEKEQIPNGIIRDFLTTVGLELDKSFIIPQTWANPSLNWDLIEIIRLCNIQFKDDISFHRYLLNSLKNVKLNEGLKKQYLLSPHQRRDLIEKYAESNEKVAREYLGRKDGRLFYAPLPESDEPWEPYEGLTIKKCIPVFTQMLHNLDLQFELNNRTIFEKVLIRSKFWDTALGNIIKQSFTGSIKKR